jgi:hypothetical protein
MTNFTKTQFSQYIDQYRDIPDWLEPIARIIFGIREETSFSQLIIIAAIWFFLFILIHDFIRLIPIFNTKLKGFLVALIITILVATSGALRHVTYFFLALGDRIDILQRWSILKIGIIIILIIILGFFFGLLSANLRSRIQADEMEEEGRKLGLTQRLVTISSRFRKNTTS